VPASVIVPNCVCHRFVHRRNPAPKVLQGVCAVLCCGVLWCALQLHDTVIPQPPIRLINTSSRACSREISSCSSRWSKRLASRITTGFELSRCAHTHTRTHAHRPFAHCDVQRMFKNLRRVLYLVEGSLTEAQQQQQQQQQPVSALNTTQLIQTEYRIPSALASEYLR